MALLLGLGAAWLLLRSGGDPAEAPSTTPTTIVATVAPPEDTPTAAPVPADNGVLAVESTPQGAVVTVNGQSQGTSPLEMTGLAAGDYTVRLELKGYEAKTQTVTLTQDAPRAEMKVALARLAPVSGTADILSTPFGATVHVDGAAVGQTPLIQFRLKPGIRKVEVTKEGYEAWASSLTVEAGKKTKVDAVLKAVVKATPPPVATPEPVDPSHVYLNAPTEVDTLAKRISGTSPAYPSELPKMRSGESRSVVVSFVVSEEGEVKEPRVVESGGSKQLDEAVLSAVRSWKFSPAVKRGINVKVRITQKQTFRAG